MISPKLYRTLLWYALLMGLTSFGLVWSLYVTRSWLITCLLLGLMGILIYTLAHHLNSTNRKMAFFFEAIENGDTALIFPDVAHAPVLTALHRGLNKVNALIRQNKMDDRAREQYYHKLVDQVSTGILTKDERGFVLMANTACKDMLGREYFTHLKQVEPIDSRLYRVLIDIKPGERHLINIQCKTAPLHLLIHAAGFKSQDQHLTIITMQDIRDELDYKELDSWVRLISVLTHEIINTVSPMTSLSESMYDRFQELETSSDSVIINKETYNSTLNGLEVLKERGGGLVDFVQSYRRLTKLPKPQKTSLDIRHLIDKMKILVSAEPNFHNVAFRQEVVPENLAVLADEKLLMQALINIVKNAIEALSDRGDGAISIRAVEKPSRKISIEISDNGPGIPPELMDDVFIPFFTTKPSGSGIGLPLSRQIVRLHGGSLTVKSSAGRGTTFLMVL